MQNALIIVSSDQILWHADSPEHIRCCPGHKQRALFSRSLYKDVIAVYGSDMH